MIILHCTEYFSFVFGFFFDIIISVFSVRVKKGFAWRCMEM